MPDFDYCFDGEPHDWRREPHGDYSEGLICGRCGVTEAEMEGHHDAWPDE